MKYWSSVPSMHFHLRSLKIQCCPYLSSVSLAFMLSDVVFYLLCKQLDVLLLAWSCSSCEFNWALVSSGSYIQFQEQGSGKLVGILRKRQLTFAFFSFTFYFLLLLFFFTHLCHSDHAALIIFVSFFPFFHSSILISLFFFFLRQITL